MPMNRIQVLPDVLANQIAAGEVIERPASVVKELLENSVDAGATEIIVEVRDGGTSYISVRDDGSGIHNDDLHLALQSHATSKIREQADLENISSLGFRGEALSSIASVSQFRLTSRLKGSDSAWQISMDPLVGKNELQPASRPVGTTVEVTNLFHTTPARRKFLRSERTEFLHIQEMVRRIALGRFHVEVRLIHNGKQVFHYQPETADYDSLIGYVMGRSFTGNSRKFDYKSEDMRLWGWLGTPENTRNQTDRQYFYLNGRMIRDKQVNHAVRMAYEERIPVGRYPTYVLYLEMDPSTSDINVHPTKYEVRFENTRDVHDFIFSCLKNTLDNREPLLPVSDRVADNKPPEYNRPLQVKTGNVRDVTQYYRKLTSNATTELPLSNIPKLGQPVACLYGRFIISERHERYLITGVFQARHYYVESMLRKASTGSPVSSRPLLVPVSIQVPERQADLLEKISGQAVSFGLVLGRNSPGSVVIREIPNLIPDLDLQSVLDDILADVKTGEDDASVRDNLIKVFSQHACDGFADSLSQDEMKKVLLALEETGIDMEKSAYPGIWRTLDIDELSVLVNSA